jgi:hypothetical protein
MLAEIYKKVGDDEKRKKAGAIVSDFQSRHGNYHPETGEKMVYENEKVKEYLTTLSKLSAKVADNTTEQAALHILKLIATDAASYTSGVAFYVSEALCEIMIKVENYPQLHKGIFFLLLLLNEEDFPNSDKNFPNNQLDLYKKSVEIFYGSKVLSLNVILPSFFENVGFNVD